MRKVVITFRFADGERRRAGSAELQVWSPSSRRSLHSCSCSNTHDYVHIVHSHTHTHTHTHVGFYGLRGLSIGVMVFILYKLYVLLPYTYPTPKLSPHRRRCIYIFPQKNSLCMIYKRFKLWGHWKCPHLLLVMPMSYPCHYTNLCPHKPHKHAHTHTHTHEREFKYSNSFKLTVKWKRVWVKNHINPDVALNKA